MQYGYFDDGAREYVITRPDTPRSWSNYLGSRLYGGIVTQGAGGYSFYKSGGQGRVTRFRFNGVPQDEPGRFVYLRDDADGDFWSASWQPVGKPLQGRDGDREDAAGNPTQASSVRHGLGYSIFHSSYRGIDSEATFFVPRGQAFEYWSVKVTNTTEKPRTISLYSYAELSNEWNYRQDLENLQYSQYVVVCRMKDGMIHRLNSTRTHTSELWFGMAGADVAGRLPGLVPDAGGADRRGARLLLRIRGDGRQRLLIDPGEARARAGRDASGHLHDGRGRARCLLGGR